jgi:hypothetical protein
MEKNITNRNSYLAVLEGDVRKSSSLQMTIQEKAVKQKGSNKALIPELVTT